MINDIIILLLNRWSDSYISLMSIFMKKGRQDS